MKRNIIIVSGKENTMLRFLQNKITFHYVIACIASFIFQHTISLKRMISTNRLIGKRSIQRCVQSGSLIVITIVILITSGCTIFKGTLDKRTGFSSELASIEKFINDDNWEDARKSMTQCTQKWGEIKPWLQLELDHGVVNEIETRMTELSAYLETEEKPTALANTRIIINYWADIGSK